MKRITRFQRDLRHAGSAVHNPLAVLVFCQPQPVDCSLGNGVSIMRAGQPVGLDLVELVDRHNRAESNLVARAGLRR